MEVHHHPEVGRKSFKEYFLEGLMIFLAVTMGFFAESLRENINNREKEKSYVVSLINNLEQDTVNMNSTIRENMNKMRGLDTLLSLAANDLTKPSDREVLYEGFGQYISYYSIFASNDATMMQLKNSGGLQYIRRDHIADSIAAYDQRMRDVAGAETPYSKAINDAVGATEEILIMAGGARTSEQFPLLSKDPAKINIFFNKVYLEKGWTENYIYNLKRLMPHTTRLIALLKKEYDIE